MQISQIPRAIYSPKRVLMILGVDIVLSLLLYVFLPFDERANAGICLLVFVGILWLTEAVNVTITALMIPLLAVGFGLMDVSNALNSFANPIIFLFFGGFALATALHIQGIDRYLANCVLTLAKGKIFLAVMMLFCTTAFLSMWISNTATATIMLPLGLGILSNLDISKDRPTFLFVLLGIAYSASIGGFGTLVGSPPNAIASVALDLDFYSWMKLGIPFVLIMLPSCIFLLFLLLRPRLNIAFKLSQEKFAWNIQALLAVVIFVCTALAWILSAKISAYFGGIKDLDAWIAIACVVVIAISGVASWMQIQNNTQWGVLWLFGGGLALSSILKDCGASVIIANFVADFIRESSWIVIIVVVATLIIFLTEFTSNTASSALLVPIFASVSEAMGASPMLLTLIIGFGAGCAFMLPVATPPNAIVFGTGQIRQQEMMKVGFLLNLVSIGIVSAFAWFVWR